MPLKPALSIHDQIALLEKRGMSIDDQSKTSAFLKSNHYYRLNIYFHKMMDSHDHFRYGVRFSEVIDIYENDSWLRNKIISMLEPIEINTRTHISHYLGLRYGPDVFYQERIYKNAERYNTIFLSFMNEVNRNPSDPVIKHHKINYGGEFPIWVVIEYLSFNTLSKYFGILQENDKKMIARNIYKVNEYLLGQWLHVLSVLRNICAHYGYLYRREYSLRPKIAREFGWNPVKNNQLFALFLVIRRLSATSKWEGFIRDIIEREVSKESFDLCDYGFPAEWKSYLR